LKPGAISDMLRLITVPDRALFKSLRFKRYQLEAVIWAISHSSKRVRAT
jgi:hypothetical protein